MKLFEDISPIEDYSDQLSLEFVDYQFHAKMTSNIQLKNVKKEMQHTLHL